MKKLTPAPFSPCSIINFIFYSIALFFLILILFVRGTKYEDLLHFKEDYHASKTLNNDEIDIIHCKGNIRIHGSYYKKYFSWKCEEHSDFDNKIVITNRVNKFDYTIYFNQESNLLEVVAFNDYMHNIYQSKQSLDKGLLKLGKTKLNKIKYHILKQQQNEKIKKSLKD
jgi:hypothetical protein